MANLTNKLGLPAPIVTAVRRDDYDPGASDITVTQLINPPKVVELSRRHDEEIEEDVSDRIWALMGKVAHSILEKGTGEVDDEAVMVEERLFTEELGWKVSGQFDRMVLLPEGDGWRLLDFKLSSVREAVHGLKAERVQQLNLLAELARRNGYHIIGLQVVMIFRDWLKPKAVREDGDYPKQQVETFDVELWEPEVAGKFLKDRVRIHRHAQGLTDDEIPICTPAERWQKPTTWAVRKQGRKTAVRVFDTHSEAEKYIQDRIDEKLRSQHWVKERPGEPTRCLHYCPVARWCQFGRWFHEEEE